MNRTPTPQLDLIWSRTQTLQRWHKLWLWHLQAQMAINPRHPATAQDASAYADAATQFVRDPQTRLDWLEQLDLEERQTRHELVAALNVYNGRAKAAQPLLHMGLTSCDITEPANQWAIRESAVVIRQHAAQIIRQLTQLTTQHADLKILARTHGQPAQLTTWGHRQATVLGPLLDWWCRWSEYNYPMRPPHGAVGTGADLVRVLVGWAGDEKVSSGGLEATGSPSQGSDGTEIPQALDGQGKAVGCPSCGTILTAREADCLDQWHADNQLDRRMYGYTATLRGAMAFNCDMQVTRQTYHRSYDLHWIAMLAELATIAETWATDRRLEAMLGLGGEAHDKQQVGSSAMPHKRNPRICERIVSLCTEAYANVGRATQHSGREWLEGDVASSAARRSLLPQSFQVADQILSNWHWVLTHWRVDEAALSCELDDYPYECGSAAVMQLLVESGVPRDQAHQQVSQAVASAFPIGHLLKANPQLTAAELGKCIETAWRQPIGTVQHQIRAVVRRAEQAVRAVPVLSFEEPI